jgi:hypothetical protein
MDDQIEPTSPAPTHRRFKLTPLPGAPAELDEGRGKGGLRRKLIIGGSAIPFAMTIHGRPAFAKKTGTISMKLSPGHSLGGGGKKGALVPSGMPSNGNGPNNWQTQYTTLVNAYCTGKETYQHCLPGQVTSNNYLNNPAITTSIPFTIPAASKGVSFSLSSGNFSNALQGGGAGVVLTVTVTYASASPGPPGPRGRPGPGGNNTASQSDNGAFFQQAITALLNAALYGSSAFGYTDAQVIKYVNSVFTTMQSEAGTLQTPAATAQQILSQIFPPNGPLLSGNNVTTVLADLNSQGTG